MSGPRPTRDQGDLAEMLETLLDKGVVINADIAVTVGETDLLGIHVRAAIASFETAAAYGLEFPSGTDMDRVRAASGVEAVEAAEGPAIVEETDSPSPGEETDSPTPEEGADSSPAADAEDEADPSTAADVEDEADPSPAADVEDDDG